MSYENKMTTENLVEIENLLDSNNFISGNEVNAKFRFHQATTKNIGFEYRFGRDNDIVMLNPTSILKDVLSLCRIKSSVRNFLEKNYYYKDLVLIIENFSKDSENDFSFYFEESDLKQPHRVIQKERLESKSFRARDNFDVIVSVDKVKDRAKVPGSLSSYDMLKGKSIARAEFKNVIINVSLSSQSYPGRTYRPKEFIEVTIQSRDIQNNLREFNRIIRCFSDYFEGVFDSMLYFYKTGLADKFSRPFITDNEIVEYSRSKTENSKTEKLTKEEIERSLKIISLYERFDDLDFKQRVVLPSGKFKNNDIVQLGIAGLRHIGIKYNRHVILLIDDVVRYLGRTTDETSLIWRGTVVTDHRNYLTLDKEDIKSIWIRDLIAYDEEVLLTSANFWTRQDWGNEIFDDKLLNFHDGNIFVSMIPSWEKKNFAKVIKKNKSLKDFVPKDLRNKDVDGFRILSYLENYGDFEYPWYSKNKVISLILNYANDDLYYTKTENSDKNLFIPFKRGFNKDLKREAFIDARYDRGKDWKIDKIYETASNEKNLYNLKVIPRNTDAWIYFQSLIYQMDFDDFEKMIRR